MGLRAALVLLLVCALFALSHARSFHFNPIRMPFDDDIDNLKGTRWAVLIAGSNGYGNYRHQADVCHAYQILRKNGLKEEHIIVMMYDDIANNPDNPRPGTIINHPHGSDVYAGVPKDYTGEAVSVDNLFAVLLGDRNATTGGSGKVVDSGPDDYVFLFYSDHGGPGVLGMPGLPNLYANDLIDVLKKKHAMGTYKEMVIYLEACESGSIFEGLLSEGLNIYVTTAANAVENSWGTYCPGMYPSPPPEFDTCLGDLYSVAWMEDSEVQNLKRETLLQQYLTVKDRTSNHNTYQSGSHVMQYGDVHLNSEQLAWFMGYDPANVDKPPSNALFPTTNGVNQRDADLIHIWRKFTKALEGTKQKKEARKKMMDALAHRMHIDRSVELVSALLFGSESASEIVGKVRPGKPLVDNWQCLKSMVRGFESKCGSLGQYGMKHMRVFANICNEGVDVERLNTAASEVCSANADPQVWKPVTSSQFSA